ncbi:Glycoside hydrolase family 55 protein [Mycena kentingensis (nom. inval.)]|nr:Glycoside hydrolase family 55 protein [Mycena kentingensis (nom. inval.)]
MKLISLTVTVLTVAAIAQACAIARGEKVARDTQWISSEDINYFTNETHIDKRVGVEQVQCYNTGTKADRASIVSYIDDFCFDLKGRTVNNGRVFTTRYNSGTFTVLISGAAINGCSFVVDNNCARLLRLPVDSCNTDGVNDKQGGVVTDSCGQWRVDPGSNGSDF